MIMCKKQEKDKDEVIHEQKAAECKQKESKPKQMTRKQGHVMASMCVSLIKNV